MLFLQSFFRQYVVPFIPLTVLLLIGAAILIVILLLLQRWQKKTKR